MLVLGLAGWDGVGGGLDDKDFRAALRERAADVSTSPRPDNDCIFLAANTRAGLEQLGRLQACLERDGAIWVIRPRGVPAITERDVLAAGKRAGLVDVKVVRF